MRYKTFIQFISEKQNNSENVNTQIKNSRKIPIELKEKLIKYVTSRSIYSNGIIHNLLWNIKKYGCSLGADKNGFFVYTHRARSKSYESPEKIPQKDIQFIESTG